VLLRFSLAIIHRRAHEVDRKYVCSACGKGYGNQSSLNLHLKLKHEEIYNDMFYVEELVPSAVHMNHDVESPRSDRSNSSSYNQAVPALQFAARDRRPSGGGGGMRSVGKRDRNGLARVAMIAGAAAVQQQYRMPLPPLPKASPLQYLPELDSRSDEAMFESDFLAGGDPAASFRYIAC
jgi:hypothetical protein